VHLVLCRLPDAPPGTKGMSPGAGAQVPARRHAQRHGHVDGLEHKMGIHGSATCALRYEGATGWLVGEPNRGLAAMFLMMNAARLHVALQGLGHLEMAAQNARATRTNGCRCAPVRPARSTGRRRPHRGTRPCAARCGNLQALAEGLRVIAYRAALALDEAEHHEDPARREAASAEAALLTPVLKAFAHRAGLPRRERGAAGLGRLRLRARSGIEQTLRDARIAMVYEGTNEIQAIDLLQRKVLGSMAPAFDRLLDALAADADGSDAGRALAAQVQAAREVVAAVRARSADPEAALAVADDFLAGCAHLLLAWAWGAIERAATQARERDAAWMDERIRLVRHGREWLLPQATVHWARVRAGAALGAVAA
jgi:hypothetical protein